MKIKCILNRLLIGFIRRLDYIWLKDSRILLFGSHGTKMVGGNSKALFDYITKRKPKLFNCYYVINHDSDRDDYVHHRSFRFMRLFLRAKTILVTHGLSDMGKLRPSRRKHVIYLWHGQGPKADGHASKRFNMQMLKDLDKDMKNATAFLTCSRLDKYLRAYDHSLKPSQILPLGYPRCDFLLKPSLWGNLLSSVYSDLPEYDKVVLYAITWRKNGDTHFFPFEDFKLKSLEEWCENQKILLLIRPHINDKSAITESSYVRALPFSILNDVTLILPEVDLLITDYSSIQTDFFLLDRPIVYVPYDLEDYLKYENFCYPGYDFWCPGEKVYTFTNFKKAVELGLAGNDDYKDQRHLVNKLVNEYQTPGATERVYNYLVKLFKIRSQ